MTDKASPTPKGIRERIKARKRAVVSETVEGFGEVPIRKLDVNDMLEVGGVPTDMQKREMVAKCVLDEEGDPVFSDANELTGIEYALFKGLLNACYRVNGLKHMIGAAAGN